MTTAAISEKIKFTYSDYLIYPTNGKQLQLIEGDFFMTPAPNIVHQDILGNLGFILKVHITQHNLGKVYFAPTDVYLSDYDVVQPDILFIRKERLHILTKNYVKGAPDIVIEILSGKTKKIDLTAKRTLYAKYGVPEYWLVDPDKKQVEVLTLSQSGYETAGLYSKGAIIRSKIIPGLKIKTSEIFRK